MATNISVPRLARDTSPLWPAKDEGLDHAEPRTPANATPTSFRQCCEEELKPLILT